MRRSDREITDQQEIKRIVMDCDVCRLGIADEDFPHIVPMNFGFRYEENLELYFHSAPAGRKIDLLRKNGRVSFQMDCSHRLIVGADAGRCTMEYESVMGTGQVEFLDGSEKLEALTLIMEHYTGKTDFTYRDKDVHAACCFRLTADTVTAKRLKRTTHE